MARLWEPINGIYTATAPLIPWSLSIPSIDGAAWVGALKSAGFGAGVGAWMAGRIAERAKQKEELSDEINSIDVAITICASIIDLAGALKNQYSSKIQGDLNAALASFTAHIENENRNSPFELIIENRKLQTVEPPILELQSLVFKQMTPTPNGVKSIIALKDSVANLNGMICAYNVLLEAFKKGDLPYGFKPAHYYLSIPVNGVVNNEYKSAVDGIATYTDDVLFFAHKLSQCLTLQGIKASVAFQKLTGEKRIIRKLELFDKNTSLIPSDSSYEAWMRGWEIDLTEPAKNQKR